MTTMEGKSAFPEDHPLALGHRRRRHDRPHAALSPRGRRGLRHRHAASPGTAWPPASRPARRSSTPPTTSAISTRTTRPTTRCSGDAQAGAAPVHRGGQETGRPRRPDARACAPRSSSVRAAWLAEWAPMLASDEVPMTPVPRDRRVHAHGRPARRHRHPRLRQPARPAHAVLPGRRAPRGYLGWGKSHALGTGLGLIIGAKLAAPDKFCVNFMGDAAFGMTGLDFETAVRCGIPILTVVLNNSAMAIEIPHLVVSHDKYGTRDIGGRYADLGARHGRLERAGRAARGHRGRLRAGRARPPRAGRRRCSSSSPARRRASRIAARCGRGAAARDPRALSRRSGPCARPRPPSSRGRPR